MKTIIMLLVAVTVVSARPQSFRPRPGSVAGPTAVPAQVTYARILRQEQDTQFDGSFNYAYETENGINGQASGVLKNPGQEDEGISIEGSYSWTSPEGIPITITYIADEQGFRAQGDAIPTSPPIPDAIQRALDYIRSLPPPKDNKNFK